MKTLTLTLSILAMLYSSIAWPVGKIQQQDIKTLTDCTNAGATGATCLPLASQIWDSTNSQQLSTSISTGALGGGGGGASVNMLANTDNPGFEQGTSGWTASGGTFSAISSGQIFGAKSGQWTASATSQTLYSGLKSIPVGLQGANCAAAISYSYPSGAAGDYSLVVSDGTNTVASQSLPVMASAQSENVTFVCPSSGSLKVGLISNVASPSAIILDGPAYNAGSVLLGSNPLVSQVSQAQWLGSVTTPVTASCEWIGSSASTPANFAAVSACPVATASGAITAPSTKIPGFTLPAGGAGVYKFVAKGSFRVVNNADCSFRFSDGTNSSDIQTISGNVSAQIVSSPVLEGKINYTSPPAANTTIQIQSACDGAATNAQILDSVANLSGFAIDVYYFPSQSQLAVNSNSVGKSEVFVIGGNGYGSTNTGVRRWTTTSTKAGSDITYTDSATLGGSFTINTPGVYCASFSDEPSSTTQIAPYISLNASSFSVGTSTYWTGYAVSTQDGNTDSGATASGCGYLNAGDVLRQQEFSSATGASVNGSWFRISKVMPSQPAPVLVGSVTSSGPGSYHTEYFNMTTACTTSPCSGDYTQSGSWVTGVSRNSVGVYTLSLASGEFSSVPSCVANNSLGGGRYAAAVNLASSSVEVQTIANGSGSGSFEDDTFSIICMGPH